MLRRFPSLFITNCKEKMLGNRFFIKKNSIFVTVDKKTTN